MIDDLCGEPEKRLTPSPAALRVARMMMLERAAGMLGGQAELAAALGIQPRSLRAKLTADRGVSNGDLKAVADALVNRADAVRSLAEKIRDIREISS